MIAGTVGDVLALDDDADSPVAGRTFTHWPLPVGRVEIRDGLAFVYSTAPGGFSIDDYRRIPDDGRVELLDGVAVVSPPPTREHQRAVSHLYRVLAGTCPKQMEAFIGPLDVHIRPATVFAPDVLLLPEDNDTPALVVEVLSKYGRSYDLRVKFSGYRDAGVRSLWIVDPDATSVTVFELDDDARRYLEAGSYSGDEVCAPDRPFPVQFRPAELTRT